MGWCMEGPGVADGVRLSDACAIDLICTQPRLPQLAGGGAGAAGRKSRWTWRALGAD